MPAHIWDCECIDTFYKNDPDAIYDDDEGWGGHGVIDEAEEIAEEINELEGVQ